MKTPDPSKAPRLYTDQPLSADHTTILGADPTHYLRNVLRRETGDWVRIFNGRDGEFLGAITAQGKKETTLTLERCLHPQPPAPRQVHLYFAPVKKARLDWVIEKAVELGATDLHPVLTQNTENRHLNAERLTAQIIEAAEQCERLDIPTLHPLVPLNAIKTDGILACIERLPDSPPLAAALPPAPAPIALLIGPEGGFTAPERDWLLARPECTPVHLGPRILRAETAICMALSLILGTDSTPTP